MGLSGIVYFAVLVSVVYGLPPKRFLIGDRCTQDPVHHNPRINHPDIGVTDYDVNMTCTNGAIRWSYPSGTIHVHFRGNHSFSACFRDDLVANLLELADITDGVDKPFTLPDDRDKEYCVHSVKKRVDIQMSSDLSLYVAAVFYRLQPEPAN